MADAKYVMFHALAIVFVTSRLTSVRCTFSGAAVDHPSDSQLLDQQQEITRRLLDFIRANNDIYSSHRRYPTFYGNSRRLPDIADESRLLPYDELSRAELDDALSARNLRLLMDGEASSRNKRSGHSRHVDYGRIIKARSAGDKMDPLRNRFIPWGGKRDAFHYDEAKRSGFQPWGGKN